MDRGPDGVGAAVAMFGFLLLLSVLVVIVVAVVLLWRRFGAVARGGLLTDRRPTGPASWGRSMAAAEHTLAERLARGEIDVADYEERIAALRRTVPPSDPQTAGPAAGGSPPDAGQAPTASPPPVP